MFPETARALVRFSPDAESSPCHTFEDWVKSHLKDRTFPPFLVMCRIISLTSSALADQKEQPLKSNEAGLKKVVRRF